MEVYLHKIGRENTSGIIFIFTVNKSSGVLYINYSYVLQSTGAGHWTVLEDTFGLRV